MSVGQGDLGSCTASIRLPRVQLQLVPKRSNSRWRIGESQASGSGPSPDMLLPSTRPADYAKEGLKDHRLREIGQALPSPPPPLFPKRMTSGEGLEATLMKMLPAVLRGLDVPHQRESAQHTINKTIIRKEERGGGSSPFQRNESERRKGQANAFLILSPSKSRRN